VAEDIKDSITHISRGKSSRNRIGSVLVPHRLRKEERTLLKRAMRYGYLEHHQWSRVNTINIYSKLCTAHGLIPIFCFHDDEKSKVTVEHLNLEQKKKTLELLTSDIYCSEQKEKDSNSINITLENLNRKNAKKLCDKIARKISKQNTMLSL